VALKAKKRTDSRGWRDGGTDISSVHLMRLLAASYESAVAADAALDLAFRADPAHGACFLWLAPTGAAGAALEAPALPAGVEQLSEAALAGKRLAKRPPTPTPEELRRREEEEERRSDRESTLRMYDEIEMQTINDY